MSDAQTTVATPSAGTWWRPTDPWPAAATNPVMRGFHPDPSACRVDGPDGTWYYLVTSTFEYLPGLPVFRSRNLVDWELVGHVLDRADQVDLQAVRDSGGLFAPTIRYDGEGKRFVVVCTVVGGTSGGNFIATATDPAGPWSDPVRWDIDGIDPSVFIDDDGSWWAHGTRRVAEPEWDQQTEVWVRRIDPTDLSLGTEEHIVWTGAVRGAVWAEGPHLFRRGEYIYLLAAEGGTGRNHAVIIARSSHPTEPFVGCPRNPVLTHRNLGNDSTVTNVGHADLIEAPDGTSWALLLASRPQAGSDLLGRETFLVPVQWQDGWPVFAPGVGHLVPEPGSPEVAPSGAADDSAASDPHWIAVRTLPEAIASTSGDGSVELRPGALLDDALPAFVAQRVQSLTSRLHVDLTTVPDGVWAGLGLRYNGENWAAVLTDGRTVRVLLAKEGQIEEVAQQQLPAELGGRPLSVRLDLQGLRATAAVGGTGSADEATELATLDVAHLCAAVSDGFVGITAGVLAHGESDEAVIARLTLQETR